MLGFLARPTARNASLPIFKVSLSVVIARRLPVVLLVLGLRVLRRTVALRWLLGVLSWIIALVLLLVLVSDTINGPGVITLLS